MSELSRPLSAQHGRSSSPTTRTRPQYELRLLASYGYMRRKAVSNRFKPGEGLVGQAALQKSRS